MPSEVYPDAFTATWSRPIFMRGCFYKSSADAMFDIPLQDDELVRMAVGDGFDVRASRDRIRVELALDGTLVFEVSRAILGDPASFDLIRDEAQRRTRA